MEPLHLPAALDDPGDPAKASRRDLERARELVLAHGWNSTSYQILNPGIRLWFSSVHEAVVGYVEHAGRLVAAGAPVCPAEALPAVAAELERDAARRRLRVCYFAAEGRLADSYVGSRRHSQAVLGAQPVWHPRCWPRIVERHASLRAQLNRARNKGVTVTEWETGQANDPEIARCLTEWLSARGLPPLGFLVEPQTLDRLTDRRIFVAHRDRALVGFLVASPVPCRNGWLVEQIVRGAAAPNGTSETMIDAALRALAAGGFDYVTLGLAPLSHRGPVPLTDNPLWLRPVLAATRRFGRRFYNFTGLDSFKAKLQPEGWEPVYALSSERHFSPRTLWAIAAAFSGGSPVRLVARSLFRPARRKPATGRR